MQLQAFTGRGATNRFTMSRLAFPPGIFQADHFGSPGIWNAYAHFNHFRQKYPRAAEPAPWIEGLLGSGLERLAEKLGLKPRGTRLIVLFG